MKQLVALTLDQLEDFIAISDIRLLKRVVMSTQRASGQPQGLASYLGFTSLVLFYGLSS